MAPSSRLSKLFVVGGTGFVGRAICERAVKMPKEVIGSIQSFSRRGVPETASMENDDNAWLNSERMKWTSMSVTRENYDNSNLKNAILESVAKGEKFAVLCSVGALFENERYKTFFEKPENLSPFVGLDDTATTYNKINRDVCMSIVDTVETCMREHNSNSNNDSGENCHNTRVPFVFVSAFTTPPGVSKNYIHSKRAAEQYIMEKKNIVKPIILRPSFLYDESRPASMGIAAALKTATSTSSFLDTFLKQSPIPSTIRKGINNVHNSNTILQAPPLRVSEVADCIITTLIDSEDDNDSNDSEYYIYNPKDILQLSRKGH